jgi:hypothetical protein
MHGEGRENSDLGRLMGGGVPASLEGDPVLMTIN